MVGNLVPHDLKALVGAFEAGRVREAQDWQRFQNVPKAEALIAAAKEMLLEEPSADLGNRLRLMQGFWKDVGPMPQR